MRTIPLEEYRQIVKMRGAREEGEEEAMVDVARKMLARDMSLQEVAEIIGWSVDYLQELIATCHWPQYIDNYEGCIYALKNYERSDEFKEACEAVMISLEKYGKLIEVRNARLEGRGKGIGKVVCSMLAHGMPLRDVAEIAGWPVDDRVSLQSAEHLTRQPR